MNFGTKGCMYNCGDECTGECMKVETKTKMSKKKYTLEDLKQAFKAGGSVISWSDWGVSMEYESFDDWFRMSYKKKKDE